MPPFVFRFQSPYKYSLEFSDEIFSGPQLSHEKILSRSINPGLPVNLDLPLRLRELRTRSRLSVSEMARLCKIDIGNYSAMERGRRPIGKKMIQKVNRALVKK